MAVSLLNSGAATSGTAASNGVTPNSASQASDMFTKLLVAQIQNQDPLSPSDPAQFVQQLTQLSQTEALQKLSSLTSANSSVLQSMQVLSLGAQVGSDVMAQARQVRIDGSAPIQGQITLEASSAATDLVLTGDDGSTYTMKLGTVAPGNVPFTIDPGKLGLPAGTYTMAVTTSSKEVPAIDIQGRLNSVRLSPTGGVVLNVANLGEVDPAAITAFNGKSATAIQ
ncbi:flagellar basal body rod modification protein [Duganella sp. Leaf126]|uniref:flagellar hook capping FlgD N-terminal domain-containing protein n=1 Tax=Duganella sp. Leaf126 TaxID=1736266 RepID=UPI0006FE1176|nr:flagellar hook capping FlgD N-terminal domain-containing protein [Duganella sp. Leaf126]KQQ36129.1 flagellar basal body rod modification protein [Duganella sp. Leaf126]